MLLRLAALITLAVSAFFLQQAAVPILEQNRKVAKWNGVDAEVTARFVDPTTAPGYTGPKVKEPAPQLQVEYRHEVNGTVYRAFRSTPRAEEWTPAGPELVTQGHATYTKRGYYDPAQPHQLFIPKPFGFNEYWPILFWAPLGSVGLVGFILRKPGRSAFTTPGRTNKGWHSLRPKYSLQYRARAAWAVAMVCSVILVLATRDYFTGEPRIHSTVANVLMGLGLLPGLIVIGIAVYYTWLVIRVGEARVAIDTKNVTPGTRLAVRVELPKKANVEMQSVFISVVCVRAAFEGGQGLRYRQREIWEETAERSVGRRGQSGQPISFEERFRIPDDAQPSSSAGVFGPWIDWEIRVRIPLENRPDYRGKFPMPVTHRIS